MNKEEPILILSMKISRPSNFATTTSQEEPHPFVAVSGFPMNKAFFFLFQDKDQIEVPRLWKAPAWHPQLLFVKEPTVQSQSLSRCNQTAAKFCMQKLPLKWS